MRFKLCFIICFTLFSFYSCTDKTAENLRNKVKSEYQTSNDTSPLSSGGKVYYVEIERKINEEYVTQLEELINTNFDRQLERFEDEELGVWSSYMNMFSWLFKSKQSWDDEMMLLSNKYFNNLDIEQEEHALYQQYVRRIEDLRKQFVSKQHLPSYTHINLPSDKIYLDALADHSKNNLLIELGTEIFGWLLTFVIINIILLFVDAGTLGAAVPIHVIVFIVTIIISIIITSKNDNLAFDSLRSQQNQNISYEYENILITLNDNTMTFYANQ